MLTLLRFILGAAFFAAPLFFLREWIGLESVLLALGLLLFYPWWTARHIAIPLGMPRLAYALTAFNGVEWWNDKPEGPVAAAAWCLSRKRTATEQAITWAEKHLDPARPLRASTVAAHAMLAASRGQLPEARTLFEGMLLFDRRTAPEAIWRLSFEWLATDAAARGDWTAVRRLTRHHLAPRVSTLILLARVAQRPPGTRKASIFEVCLTRVPFRSPDLSPIFADVPISSQPRAGELKSVVEQWESKFGDERLREHLSLRAAALGGGDADAALNQLRQLVQSDLEESIGVAVQNGETISEESPLFKAALNSGRRKLLSELSERVTRMDERRRRDRALPAIDEWKEFLALRRTYSLLCAQGDRNGSGTAFYTTCTRLNVFAVWLLDQKKEKAIANAIFRFLLSEAERNKSPDREIISRNAKVSL
jgi:hypothetical protein